MRTFLPLVSVVAVCWNRKDDVREGLSRLGEQSWPNIEVIIVDNNSQDGTAAMIREEFPEVILLTTAANVGVAAYNEGFRRAGGEYVVILDDDSFPAGDAIERMVEKFAADPGLGVVAFDVRDYEHYDRNTRQEDGGVSFSGSYGMSFHGAGAGVRREVLLQAGGYPEEFFLYFNETDTALRIWDAGYRIEFFPDVVSYHKSSPVNRVSFRAPFYHTRNLFWLVWKNYPAAMMMKTTVLLLYYVFYHSFEQHTLVYVKAFWNALAGAGKIMDKRKPVERKTARKVRINYRSPFTSFK